MAKQHQPSRSGRNSAQSHSRMNAKTSEKLKEDQRRFKQEPLGTIIRLAKELELSDTYKTYDFKTSKKKRHPQLRHH